MDTQTKREVIGTLIKAERPDLANDAAVMIKGAAKLSSSIRSKANKTLRKAGLDGNGRFRNLSHGLGTVAEALTKNGIQQGEAFDANVFRDKSGQRNFSIEFVNEEDPFSPEPISNSMLVIQWHTHDNGQFEIVSYLS